MEAIGNQGLEMAFFIFNGRGLSDEEVALGTPDASEAKSIARHVERCATRYKMFMKRQADQGDDIQQIKLMLFIFGIIMVLLSEPARNMLSSIGKSFGL